jgi:hypothetical protein
MENNQAMQIIINSVEKGFKIINRQEFIVLLKCE